jgi:hypothetical protein
MEDSLMHFLEAEIGFPSTIVDEDFVNPLRVEG